MESRKNSEFVEDSGFEKNNGFVKDSEFAKENGSKVLSQIYCEFRNDRVIDYKDCPRIV